MVGSCVCGIYALNVVVGQKNCGKQGWSKKPRSLVLQLAVGKANVTGKQEVLLMPAELSKKKRARLVIKSPTVLHSQVLSDL